MAKFIDKVRFMESHPLHVSCSRPVMIRKERSKWLLKCKDIYNKLSPRGHDRTLEIFEEHAPWETPQIIYCANHTLNKTQHSSDILRKAAESDMKKIPINLYLDLSKAFDSLLHEILLKKLQHYGICGAAINLMASYLKNRKQFVQFEGYKSDMKAICNGVPQGSILGPLLFLVYINDFPNASKVLNFLMCADDTTLYCCLEDIQSDNKEQVLNNELQRVHSWLNANKLSLNVRKTKYMIFRKYKSNDIGELNLRISNDTIEHVNEFNFLGLHLNSKLNWDTHLNIIEKRISRAVGIIRKLQLIFPRTILLSIYNALILPHINYCLLSWGSGTAAKGIFLQQKRAIRAISSAGYKAHTEPLFKIYKILKLEDVYNYRLLVFYYNLKKKQSSILPHIIPTHHFYSKGTLSH